MPFRSWNPRNDRTRTATPAGEVDRLAADPRVHRIFEWLARHEREIADFQLAITAVPAPPFCEQARADFLRGRFEALGMVTCLDDAGNLLAQRGEIGSGGAAIAISAHLDTVFPAGIELDVRREDDRLLGPGISDNGAGLAALWALASAFTACGISTAAPLLFIANVGEEGEGNLRGMRHLYSGYGADANGGHAAAGASEIAALIALDGAGVNSVITQALGCRRFEVSIAGPGGHSWSDYGTPNPIVAAALAISRLAQLPLPLNPRTTMNIGCIEGGTSVNTIPAESVFKVDFRSVDAAWLDELEARLREAVGEACAEAEIGSTLPAGCLHYNIVLMGERPVGELPESSPLLAAIRAVDAHLGIRSELLRASTDANIPLSLGLPALSLGAGGNGGGAHTVHEWYDPAGRERALKRLALAALLLAKLTDAEDGVRR